MYFVIGSVFILLCGSVAAQQSAVESPAVASPAVASPAVASPAVASPAVQECYSPKVWAFCAALDGTALSPACIDPEEPNPDSTKPKLCDSSCRCANPVLESSTQNQETLVQPSPSRSYPPPKLLQWGETPQDPATQKDILKNLKFDESSNFPSYELAEYPEDAEIPLQQQSPVDHSNQLNFPDTELITEPPSVKKQNPSAPILDGLPSSGNEMFNLDGDVYQNTIPPLQRQIQFPPDQNKPIIDPQQSWPRS